MLGFRHGLLRQSRGVSPVGALGTTQDYGFFSEGLCIYGLGHNAIFWGFQANDITQECTGSGRTTTIEPCNCGGDLYWGELHFDVDLARFDSFLVEIFNSAGTRLIPADPASPGYSLITEPNLLDLSDLPVAGTTDRLTVKVQVESDEDPWALGAQTFTIEFERRPRLVE